MSRPEALVLATGGTISMTNEGRDGLVPVLAAVDLLREMGFDDDDVESVDLGTRPGAHLQLEHLYEMAGLVSDAARRGLRGVVVIQGTDTIEEVAFGLDVLVGHDLPVVVTGGMRGAHALGADGPANLADAIATARSADAVGLGVLVVLAGEIHAARHVRKGNTMVPHAFSSCLGPLGWVVEGVPRVELRPVRGVRSTVLTDVRNLNPLVEVLTATYSADARLVDRLRTDRPDGLVVEGFGAGHVPPSWVGGLADLAADIPVVLASRVGSGPLLRTTYGFAGSERDLLNRGLIHGGLLDGPKVALAVKLLLDAGATDSQMRAFFDPES